MTARPLALLFLSALVSQAAEPEFSARALPTLALSQRVLSTHVVRAGQDAFSYQRVSPPPAPLAPAPAASTSPETTAAPNFAAASLNSAPAETPLTYLPFSAHVFGLGADVTEINWQDDEGVQKRVLVHDDLSHLACFFTLTLERTHYDFSLMNQGGILAGREQDLPIDLRRALAQTRQLPRGHYQTAAPSGQQLPRTLTPAETEALDVLLAHADINREALQIAQVEAMAKAEVEAERERLRNLAPKNVQIRFWPVLSQRHAATR